MAFLCQSPHETGSTSELPGCSRLDCRTCSAPLASSASARGAACQQCTGACVWSQRVSRQSCIFTASLLCLGQTQVYTLSASSCCACVCI